MEGGGWAVKDLSWNNSSLGVSCDMFNVLILAVDLKAMLGRYGVWLATEE